MTLSDVIVFNHERVILDASCLINLRASGQLPSILTILPVPIAVAAYVHVSEVLWEYAGPDDDITRTKQPIDLRPLIDHGHVQLVDIESDAEAQTMVNYAARMDDGEAITSAIAVHRNWAIAVDDRKARRVMTDHNPQIQIVSTLELVRYWAEALRPSDAEVTHALQKIRYRGKYLPHADHPQFAWWQAYFRES